MGQKGNIKVEIQINVHIKTHILATLRFENYLTSLSPKSKVRIFRLRLPIKSTAEENVINYLFLFFMFIYELEYLRMSMRYPKSKFPIAIIVFDEHELIVDVIQALSISTCKSGW